MKLRLTTIATVVALVSGFGVASAAGNHAMSNATAPTTAKDSLSLTSAQERTAWKDISRQANSQMAPSGFSPTIGVTVPTDISLKPVPAKAASQVPTLRPYDYALLQNRLLIVNPSNKKVVDVINRHV